jgi:hypothetical protein
MSQDKLVTFLDNIQRTIIATLVSEDKTTLTVTKPVILQVTPTPDKKLQVQLYPVFFREFTANRDEFANWTYSKSTVVVSDVELEANLQLQYAQMFATTAINANTPVVKLFDDEAK